MGPAKVQRYGVQILAEIASYTGEHGPGPRSADAARVIAGIDAGAQMSHADAPSDPVYDALRAWRRRRAVALGEKLWRIASNDALQRVAAAKPRSVYELIELECLDMEQVQAHGEQIVAEVHAFEAAADEKIPPFLRSEPAS
jgi:ribonuclease D